MQTTILTFHHRTGITPEEVLEDRRQQCTPHGNDLDLLSQSLWLLMAGHYRESLEFSFKVQPSSTQVEELPDQVDKSTAHAAYVAAPERAQPLYEQAALEIEGKVDGSRTMEAYFISLEMLRSNPDV